MNLAFKKAWDIEYLIGPTPPSLRSIVNSECCSPWSQSGWLRVLDLALPPKEKCMEADNKPYFFISNFNEAAFVHICRNLLNCNGSLHNWYCVTRTREISWKLYGIYKKQGWGTLKARMQHNKRLSEKQVGLKQPLHWNPAEFLMYIHGQQDFLPLLVAVCLQSKKMFPSKQRHEGLLISQTTQGRYGESSVRGIIRLHEPVASLSFFSSLYLDISCFKLPHQPFQ